MPGTQLVHVHEDEAGHAEVGAAAFIAGAGIVALGFGAANGTDWLCIAGGLVGGLGLLAFSLLDHMRIDYKVFSRLERLEKK